MSGEQEYILSHGDSDDDRSSAGRLGDDLAVVRSSDCDKGSDGSEITHLE